MALKADRHELLTDMSFFLTGTTGNRGCIVIHSTGGSGAAMDQASAVVAFVTAATHPSSSPAGLLLNDVVNYDLTRQHINWHKDEVQLGGKVLLLRRGWVVTNNVSGTPSAGDKAYYDNAGNLNTTANGPAVGRFLSAKDADGYAKVDINITG